MSKQRALDLEIADWRPTLENVTWLGVALLLVAVPHASRQPLWVSAAFVVFASGRKHNKCRTNPKWLTTGVRYSDQQQRHTEPSDILKCRSPVGDLEVQSALLTHPSYPPNNASWVRQRCICDSPREGTSCVSPRFRP